MRTLYHIIIEKRDLEEFNRVIDSFGLESKLLKYDSPTKIAVSVALSKYEYLFVHITFKGIIREADSMSEQITA